MNSTFNQKLTKINKKRIFFMICNKSLFPILVRNQTISHFLSQISLFLPVILLNKNYLKSTRSSRMESTSNICKRKRKKQSVKKKQINLFL